CSEEGVQDLKLRQLLAKDPIRFVTINVWQETVIQPSISGQTVKYGYRRRHVYCQSDRLAAIGTVLFP
ncbi:hypothetical protein HDV02_000957, partial [Globomyces sp. JEL0801]